MSSPRLSWIRREARRFRATLHLDENSLVHADTVLRAALREQGLSALRLRADDPLLAGAYAVLDRDAECVWIRGDLSEEATRALLAHEIGHSVCHACSDRVEDGFEATSGFGAADSVVTSVDGYGPSQRSELEATGFGAELLLPARQVAEAFLEGRSAAEIATIAGVDERAVHAQLTSELLQPQAAEPQMIDAQASVCLDEDQMAASHAPSMPVLVTAGPGTGKTRTLIERVRWLCDSGVPSEHILALTYSRNAADDMRERLHVALGPAGSRVPVHTVHGYGLELLRRFGTSIGLPPNPGIVDRVLALDVLESAVACMGTDLDTGIDDPVAALPRLADAVARMRECCCTTDGGFDAQSRLSRLASCYEAELRRRGCVDYADMVALPLELLREHQHVRDHVMTGVRHVLVDEWQDLGPVCVEFVMAISDGGRRLWAVGDLQQSIYGFRGAGGDATRTDVSADFRQYPLRTNYRGCRMIVAALNQYVLSQRIGPGDAVAPAHAELGAASVAVAEDETALAEGMSQRISAVWQRAADQTQAVLCRTNAQAARLASLLAARGLATVGSPSALECEDVRRVLAGLDEFRAAHDASHAELRADVCLRVGRELFGEHGIVRISASWPGRGSVSRRRSLAWLVQAAEASVHRHRQMPNDVGVDQVSAFLSDVRRAVALGEDRVTLSPLDRCPPIVPVMTIHGSKGLEFDHVYIPFLNHGCFPPRHRSGLTEDAGRRREGDDDEAKLLFVGMSRARLGLMLSWSCRISGRTARPAALCKSATEAICSAGGSVLEWSAAGTAAVNRISARPMERETATEITLADVEMYRRCPRRWCQDVARPEAVRSGGIWALHLAALRHIARTILRRPPKVRGTCMEEAMAEWDARTCVADASARSLRLLRVRAEAMILRMCADGETLGGEFGRLLEFAVADHRMTVLADRIEQLRDGHTVIERFIPRAPFASDARRLDLAALHYAGKHVGSGLPTQVWIRYLPSGERAPYRATEALLRGSRKRIEDAIAGIEAGLFPARASDMCPQCPYLLTCPRASQYEDSEDGGVVG